MQSMVKMKQASSLRASPRHPAEDRCRPEARRVQLMVKMKPASSPRAAPRHPAGDRCRVQESPAICRGQLGAAAVEKIRLRGPVFSALCHFRSAAGRTVGLVARDVKQSMSVVESSRKSVGKEAPASRKGRLGAAAVHVCRRVVEEVRSSGRSSRCPSSSRRGSPFVGKEAPASRRGQLGAAAVEKVRLRGPVFSALCHFRSAAGKTVGLVAHTLTSFITMTIIKAG